MDLFHDGPRRYYAEWGKSDRGRQMPCDRMYMWNLKNKILTKNEKTERNL